MGIWEKQGMEDHQMLKELKQMAEGYDAWGNRISHMDQMAAIEAYKRITESKARIEADKQRSELAKTHAAADIERAKADTTRAETDAEVARRRVAVEEGHLQLKAIEVSENLRLKRAEVFVKALDVFVRGGADPKMLEKAIENFGQQLLPSPELLKLTDSGGSK